MKKTAKTRQRLLEAIFDYSKRHPNKSAHEIADMVETELTREGIKAYSPRTIFDYCKPGKIAEYEASIGLVPEKEEPLPGWLPAIKLAAENGVSESTIARWFSSGKVERISRGNTYLYRLSEGDEPTKDIKEWLPMEQLAERVGKAERTCWHWLKNGKITKLETESGCLYSLTDEKPKSSDNNVYDDDDEPDDSREVDGNYYYNETEDVYLVYVTHKRRPIMVTGEDMRAMKAAYSAMSPGGYDTISEICKTFKISKKNFEQIKKSMKWSHSDDPYTDEDHFAREPNELAEDLLQKKKEDFDRVFRKKEWKRIEKDATSWREMLFVCNKKELSSGELKKHIDTITSVKEYLNGSEVQYFEPSTTFTPKPVGNETLVIPISDIHYGKKFLAGQSKFKDYNQFVADVRMQQIMDILTRESKNLSHIKNVVYLSLGDNFESLFGNMRGGQYITMDILGKEQWKKVVNFHSNMISHIRSLFPDAKVTVQFIPGNHDRVFQDKSFNSEEVINAILADRISCEFKNDAAMDWIVGDQVTSMMLTNNVNLISHHGHIVRVPDTNKDVNNVITLYGAKTASRYIVAQGHLHEFKYRSGSNFKYFINPSICGSDDFTVYNLKLDSPAEFCMIRSTEHDDMVLGPYTLQ